MTFLRWELLRDNGNVLEILLEVWEIYDVAFVTLNWRGRQSSWTWNFAPTSAPTENESVTLDGIIVFYLNSIARNRIKGIETTTHSLRASSRCNRYNLSCNIRHKQYRTDVKHCGKVIYVIASRNVIGRNLFYYLIAF